MLCCKDTVRWSRADARDASCVDIRPRAFHSYRRVPLCATSNSVGMMMEGMDKPSTMHILHSSDWNHSGHTQLVVQQQVISNHASIVNDDIRFSIINCIGTKSGIWDSMREKTAGLSRKELFIEVTTEINQQHQISPPLTAEEVEKQWKNLKDTYIKTRKKLTYNPDGSMIPPKWKFYASLTFLEALFHTTKRRYDNEDPMAFQANVVPMVKRMREEEFDEEDECMGFCRSLVYSLKEIACKDRIQYVKLQKAIRDVVHDYQMNVLKKFSHVSFE